EEAGADAKARAVAKAVSGGDPGDRAVQRGQVGGMVRPRAGRAPLLAREVGTGDVLVRRPPARAEPHDILGRRAELRRAQLPARWNAVRRPRVLFTFDSGAAVD